jgi:hypothetical protein
MAPKRHPTTLLDETMKALATVEAELAARRQQRAVELAGATNIGELDKLDESIRALETTAGRHRERAALLQAECEQERIERAPGERASGADRSY